MRGGRIERQRKKREVRERTDTAERESRSVGAVTPSPHPGPQVLEQLKKWDSTSHTLKEQKDALKFYITVLFYEPALLHPTILESVIFFLLLLELDSPLLWGMLKYFKIFQALSPCSRSWARRRTSHILAGRPPTGFKKAAGQECQVTLEITSWINIVGTHAVILLIFFFSNQFTGDLNLYNS